MKSPTFWGSLVKRVLLKRGNLLWKPSTVPNEKPNLRVRPSKKVLRKAKLGVET